MSASITERGLPLLVVIEGENDICFLKGMSDMLHRADPALPDLLNLERQHKLVFLTTGGSNLADWAMRLSALHRREFYLIDREQDPETTNRRQVVELINSQPGCFATLTTRRTVENYLHPQAIRKASGIDLVFDDDTDVAGLLALKLMARSESTACWTQLPYKRQRRLHEKAKKVLNQKAVQFMTPALLAQQDRGGEIIGWLHTIRRMTT